MSGVIAANAISRGHPASPSAATLAGTEFADTATPVSTANYKRVSALSRLVYTVTAQVMTVEAYCDIYGDYPNYACIGLRVDGANRAPLQCTASGTNRWHVALGPGQHTVELTTGLTTRIPPIEGTWITAVGFSSEGAGTVVTPSGTGRVVIYGDSIAVGDSAASSPARPVFDAWTMVLRNAVAVPVALEAYGRRSLNDDGADSTARSAFAAILAQYSPATIYLAIGTNDYGLNKWSAASFGTAYAATLDAIHSALPTAVIYAQTPLNRATETANGSGSTLGDYRNQIATAQAARSAWVTLVDGTAILTTGQLADGLHPTVAGHAAYAASVKTTLGL